MLDCEEAGLFLGSRFPAVAPVRIGFGGVKMGLRFRILAADLFTLDIGDALALAGFTTGDAR